MKNKELCDIKKLLIVVDMVNGFVKEGAMADPYIGHIIKEQISLIKRIIEEKEKVAFVRDSHEKDCVEFNRFPIHCLNNTKESEIVDELKLYEIDSLVYKKNSTSLMFAEYFMNDINRMKKLKEIIITGCCTDICVLNLAIPLKNYFDQCNIEISIVVPKNCVETYNSCNHNRKEYNDMAFKLMIQSGIKLVKEYGGK